MSAREVGHDLCFEIVRQLRVRSPRCDACEHLKPVNLFRKGTAVAAHRQMDNEGNAFPQRVLSDLAGRKIERGLLA